MNDIDAVLTQLLARSEETLTILHRIQRALVPVATTEVEAWLTDHLKDGEGHDVAEILEAGWKERGFSRAEVFRARERLAIWTYNELRVWSSRELRAAPEPEVTDADSGIVA